MGYSLVCLALLVLGVAVHAEEPEKIVGGRFAHPTEFPFQVSLQILKQHLCGGSLISRRHVLTAAHCVYNHAKAPYRYFKVVTGTNDIQQGGEVHDVLHVKYHEGYIPSREHSWVNDIALITLKDSIKVSKTQRPIALGRSRVPANVQVVVSGFGRISAKGPISKELKTADMNVISNDKCQAHYTRQPIHDTQICIYRATGTGVCSGDSGGPLIYNNAVVGVASWVTPCAQGAPDVYTRVSDFIDWIEEAQREA